MQVCAHSFLVGLVQLAVAERRVVIARAGLASTRELEGDRVRLMEKVANADVCGRDGWRGWALARLWRCRFLVAVVFLISVGRSVFVRTRSGSARGFLRGRCEGHDGVVEMLCRRAPGHRALRIVGGLLGQRAGVRVVCPARLVERLMRVRR